MRVAMTGSSGMVGTALGASLERDGHEVLRMRRGLRPDPSAVWNPAEGWIREGALEGCDAVVNLAGASIGEGRWTASRKALLRSSRIDSTRLLVDHLGRLASRPGVLVSASAVGYYGDRGDDLLDEDEPPGSGFLATLARDWESEALRATELGVRTILIRSGLILSTTGGALPRLLLPFKFGLGGRLGSGKQWSPWIALADHVAAIRHLLASDVAGPVNLVAPEQVTNRDFTRAVGGALGRPTPLPAPAFALRLALGQMADELLLDSQRVSSERLQHAGYQFTHPRLAGAFEAVLAA